MQYEGSNLKLCRATIGAINSSGTNINLVPWNSNDWFDEYGNELTLADCCQAAYNNTDSSGNPLLDTELVTAC